MAGLEARTAGLLRLGAWFVTGTLHPLLPEPDQLDLLTLLRQHRMALGGVLGGSAWACCSPRTSPPEQ